MRKLITLGALITMFFGFNACTENEYIPQENDEMIAPLSRTTVQQSEIAYCGVYEIVDFMAGQHYLAGNIIVGNDKENLYVTYLTKDGWQFKATHLYIGENPPLKAAPGQFPYKSKHSPATTEYTYVFPLETLTDCMVIAAHAEVQKVVDGVVVQSETAWGKGDRIAVNGNWSMMFNYCKQECEPDDDPDPDPEITYSKETAWGFGPKYGGNWAMYTPYNGEAQTVNIIAGQHYLVGYAHFTAAVNGKTTLTIELIEGSKLADVKESVKIQGYNGKAPSGNPAPGQFKTYKGTSLVLELDAFNYYGIHLDVMVPSTIEKM